MTHATVKSRVCQECGERSAYLSDVKNHMLTHTGVKPNVVRVSLLIHSFIHKRSTRCIQTSYSSGNYILYAYGLGHVDSIIIVINVHKIFGLTNI